MSTATQLQRTRTGLNRGLTAAWTQREPLAIRALMTGLVVLAIHVVASRVGLNTQLTQDLANLADPAGLIFLVVFTRRAVTPVAAPRHRDGRRLVPAESQ